MVKGEWYEEGWLKKGEVALFQLAHSPISLSTGTSLLLDPLLPLQS